MISLSEIAENKSSVLSAIKTSEKIKERLASMGLEIGKVVRVVNRTKIGKNLVVEVDSAYDVTRIMINKKEADLIFVNTSISRHSL